MNGFLHKLSPCPLYVIFWPGKNTKKKQKKRRFRKKTNFIYALHFFVSLTFCTYLKRLTSVSGLTEQISRSAEILYNMYMYFYSYAYKYMSVICLLSPVSFILSPLSYWHAGLGWGKLFWEKHLSEGKTWFFSATPSINTKKILLMEGFALSCRLIKKKDILEFFVLSAIAKQTAKHWTF